MIIKFNKILSKSLFIPIGLVFLLAGCGAPDCQKVSNSMLKVLQDKEVLRAPFTEYKITKSSAVDFYWGSKIKKMISVQYGKEGKAPVNVVLASNKLSYPALLIAADPRSYKVLNIGDPALHSLDRGIEEWQEAKQCMLDSKND